MTSCCNSKDNSLGDYQRLEPKTGCCLTSGRTLCSYLLWILCCPCKCICGNEQIDEMMMKHCCKQTYLPMEIIDNWLEYKQMLEDIHWEDSYKCGKRFNGNISAHMITKEKHHDLYMTLLIINNYTNNQPLRIQCKSDLNNLITHSKMSYDNENSIVSKQLDHDKRKAYKVKKILLLGSERSGKSTLSQQIKRVYGRPYSQQERKSCITSIHQQCLTDMKLALKALEKYQIENDTLELSIDAIEAKDCLMKIDCISSVLNDKLVTILKCLWNEAAVQKMYEMRSSTKIEESSAYFWNKLDLLASPNYVPDQSDMVLVRSHTKGINEELYEIPDGKGYISIIDVGGQKSQRKKWIHCFDSVTAVIFVASLSCYDESKMNNSDLYSLICGYIDMVYHSDNIPVDLILLIKQFCGMENICNAMTEQLELFDYICNCDVLEDTSIILFLTKKDLFADKIRKVPLQVCPSFFNYSGDRSSFDVTTKYIRQVFTSLNKNPQRKNIFTHIVCATDHDNVMKVFADVQHIVMESSLIEAGLLDWDDNHMYRNVDYVRL